MDKLYFILSAFSFMLSCLFFFWILICRHNIKQMLARRGIVYHEDEILDTIELNSMESHIVRNYRIAVNMWIISLISFLGFALAAFLSG